MTDQQELFTPPPRLCRCWFADGVLLCDTPHICYGEDDND